MLPREHGAWAMLLVPLVTGMGAAGALSTRGAVLALTCLCFFLFRQPLTLAVKSVTGKRGWAGVTPQIRSWAAIYGFGTIAGGLCLIAMGAGIWLVFLALTGAILLVLYLFQVGQRAEMSATGEMLGVLGLALGAPAAYYATTGRVDATAAFLWVLTGVYFGATIFYIKLKVREQPRLVAPPSWVDRLYAGRVTIAYHVVMVLTVLLFAVTGSVPLLLSLAFVPAMVKAVNGTMQWTRRPNLKHLGMVEAIHAAVFAIVLITAYLTTPR